MKALAIKNWFKNKDGKPKNKALVIVEWVLFGIFGVIFAFVLAANISGMIHKKENYNHTIRFGVGCFYVLSESMEPDYMKGSAIITYKEDIEDVYQRFITTDNPKIDITFMNIDSGIVAKDYNDKYEYMELVKTDMVMTHRLIDAYINEDVAFGKGRYVFMTAGINPQSNTGQENQYQVFTEKQYLGVVRYNSDSLGGFLEFITSAG